MFVVHCLPWSTVQKRFMVLFMFFDQRGEGVLCLKIFPFFPFLLFTPLPYLFLMTSLSFFFMAWLKREINHTFYIFLNKPVRVLLLSIINCYSLQRSSLANLFLNEKKKPLSRGDPRIVSLKWTKYTHCSLGS